jgi:hypothetical protein
MLVACWSAKGGVGVSVVAAGVVAAEEERGAASLLVDLCGDQPRLHGRGDLGGAGVAGWLRAGPDVPDDALERLEAPLSMHRSLLVRGTGALEARRAVAFAEAVAAVASAGRRVIVDVGTAVDGAVGRAVVEAADRSVLVLRACPLAMPDDEGLVAAPDAVVVVRDRRRALGWREIGERVGAPVVAELDVDPAVGASVDAGLLARPLPRRFLAALSAIR